MCTTRSGCTSKLLNAWNNQDAEGFAAPFTEDGNVVGFDGSSMNGRGEIAAELGRIFATTRRRPMSPSSARSARWDPRPGGHFKIEVFQNTPAAYHGRPDLAEQLTEELTEVLQADRGVVAVEG